MDQTWIEVCNTGDIEKEDVMRFDHSGRTFAIYRTLENATTPPTACAPTRKSILRGGFVMGHIIECPSITGDLTSPPASQGRARVCEPQGLSRES